MPAIRPARAVEGTPAPSGRVLLQLGAELFDLLRRFAQGANVVVLESDVAKAFPNSETGSVPRD